MKEGKFIKHFSLYQFSSKFEAEIQNNRLSFITSITSMMCLVGTNVRFVMSPYWDQMTLYIFDECFDRLRKLMRTLWENNYMIFYTF